MAIDNIDPILWLSSNGVNTGHLLVQKIPEVMTQLLDGSISFDTEDSSKLKVDFRSVSI
jgi:hypothetical protein